MITTDDPSSSQPGIVLDSSKKTSTYYVKGATGCKNNLYEGACQKNGAKSGKKRCLALGVQGCAGDRTCAVVTKGGKQYCWIDPEPEPEPEPKLASRASIAVQAIHMRCILFWLCMLVKVYL